ncbi:tyrosine-type recombinase/integrase [Pseudogemmobacter sonorensis]|uniref:tyrosine-type recombinase/integrase n=1 Tax=Pseudogemmobacter sonorensis TaxID=2989681 RepID=UPI003676C3E0
MAQSRSKHPEQRLCAYGNTAAETVTWDTEVSGLGLRERGGKRSWIVQTRIEGRSVKRTLAPERQLTREAARLAAEAVIGALREPDPDTAPKDAPLAEFCENWLADCAGQWKPATIKSHRYDASHHILPLLGRKMVSEIEAEDVRGWFDGMNRALAGRNRSLAVLSGMMRHAELIGMRKPGSNPCAGMRRHGVTIVARALKPGDFARLGRALRVRQEREPLLVALVRFIAMTGCRRGEALALRWDWIDGNRAALPDAKAGPRAIWLGKPVLDLLAALPRISDLVFAEEERPLRAIRLDRFWHETRKAARLGTLRLHDLRHSFATTAISAGESPRTVARLLGHSEFATTEAYIHLADETLRDAAISVGAHLNRTLAAPSDITKRNRQPATPPSRPSAIPPHLLRDYRRSRLLIPAFCEKHGLDRKLFWKRCRPISSATGGKLANEHSHALHPEHDPRRPTGQAGIHPA